MLFLFPVCIPVDSRLLEEFLTVNTILHYYRIAYTITVTRMPFATHFTRRICFRMYTNPDRLLLYANCAKQDMETNVDQTVKASWTMMLIRISPDGVTFAGSRRNDVSGRSCSGIGFLLTIQLFAKCDVEPICHRIGAPKEEVTNVLL